MGAVATWNGSGIYSEWKSESLESFFRRPGVSREKDYITHMRSKPRARRSQDGDSPTDENQALGGLLASCILFYLLLLFNRADVSECMQL